MVSGYLEEMLSSGTHLGEMTNMSGLFTSSQSALIWDRFRSNPKFGAFFFFSMLETVSSILNLLVLLAKSIFELKVGCPDEKDENVWKSPGVFFSSTLG